MIIFEQQSECNQSKSIIMQKFVPRPVPSRCTKCNSHSLPINIQCTNFILFDVAL